MRAWVFFCGLALSTLAWGQDEPAETTEEAPAVEDEAAPDAEPTEEPEPAKRPPAPPVEMTPERKAKAEYWEKRRIDEARTWHNAVRTATEEWAQQAGIAADVQERLMGALNKMLETDNMIRAQMQGGEIKARDGREQLAANRKAAAETVNEILGADHMEKLRSHLQSVGGAY